MSEKVLDTFGLSPRREAVADARPLPRWAVLALRATWVVAAVVALSTPVVVVLLVAQVLLMPDRHRRQMFGISISRNGWSTTIQRSPRSPH